MGKAQLSMKNRKIPSIKSSEVHRGKDFPRIGGTPKIGSIKIRERHGGRDFPSLRHKGKKKSKFG